MSAQFLLKKSLPHLLNESFRTSGAQPCYRRSTGRDSRLTSEHWVPTLLARVAAREGPYTHVHTPGPAGSDLVGRKKCYLIFRQTQKGMKNI